MRDFIVRIERWVENDPSIIISLGKMFLVIGIPLILFLFSVAGIADYIDSNNPHIVLEKSDWSCTHEHTMLVPMLAGKTVMMMPESVCDDWQMNDYR